MTLHVNWHEDIACRDADLDLFFPIGITGAALRQMEEAKRICRDCPVQIQCLGWALENGAADGVWGGTTPEERRVRMTHAKASERSGDRRKTSEPSGPRRDLERCPRRRPARRVT
jgi:WhiB family transcriptional regulator, redox-sensing transcriptional regulator